MEEYIFEAMKYFSVEQWTRLDGSEQMKYGQILYIYYACSHLGIQVVTPDFMCKQKNRKEEFATEMETFLNTCEFCDTVFNLKEDKVMHRETCQKRFDFIKKKKYACDKCNFSSDHLGNLKQHILTHSNEKKYFCDICQITFRSKYDIKTHNKHIHSKTKHEYKCEKCSYKTHRKWHLQSHMKVHSDVKTFICEYCNKGFNHKQEFNFHLYKHNNKEKPYKCTDCEKSFVTKKDLTRHTNAIHLKNKQYKCNQCVYSSADKANLKRHTYTHLNEKPFKCNICDYQCCTSQNLIGHLKKKHDK